MRTLVSRTVTKFVNEAMRTGSEKAVTCYLRVHRSPPRSPILRITHGDDRASPAKT